MTDSSLMTPARTLLFAIAGGAAVGNLYWAQPLMEFIATDLHASTASAGWLITATQIGYALGILLIVPLGDILNRRRLVPAMMFAAAVALLLCAVAPTMGLLLVTVTLLGVSTVGGQLLTPLAGDLADDTNRGHVVGTVVSGILTGILVSRTISGLVADVAGWRAIYIVAAVVDVAIAVMLLRVIPDPPRKARVRYSSLIASVGKVVARERTVRWTLVLAGLAFGLFTMFWTALTFLLSGPPYDYPVSVIGLFGLVGLAGAIAAQRTGKLHDRGWSLPVTGICWALVVASFGLAFFGAQSVVWLIVAILGIDIAIQGINILNQTRLFEVDPAARSRLNTAFVTNNFLWGAAGSAAASLLWTAGGWTALCTAGAIGGAAAILVWAIGRRGPLQVPSATRVGTPEPGPTNR